MVLATALLTLAFPAPAGAWSWWWNPELRFRLGWPPLSFGDEYEKIADVERLVHASLTEAAWKRGATKVRSIATGDSRAQVEAALGIVVHTARTPAGGLETVKVADGYVDAISNSRRMQFGYLDHRMVIRKWIVSFDGSGRVSETEVVPDGMNDALLREPKLPDDVGRGTVSTPYDVDYLVAGRRGYAFMSPDGWRRVEPRLRKVSPGDSRLELEEAVSFRYYLLGLRAWPMGDGFLPDASKFRGETEILAFGWAEHYQPTVKAQVFLEDDRILEIRYEK